jgi:hypothetical protein
MKKKEKILKIINKLLAIFRICRAPVTPEPAPSVPIIPKQGLYPHQEELDTPEDNVW